ncbi:MAG TPA: DNA gyrase modulator, partial [Thermoleophilia bacterium]
MKEFALLVLDLLSRSRPDYADVRVVRRRQEGIQVKNGRLEAWSDEEDVGFGVRLLLNGYWGFAGASELTPERAGKVVAQALEI